MNVDGNPTRTIWPATDGISVEIIDQTLLPHRYEIATLRKVDDAAHAIKAMLVRGAPLIGATAAYGIWLAMLADTSNAGLKRAYAQLFATRPTAVNLRWALDRAKEALDPLSPNDRTDRARTLAAEICDEDVGINHAIGQAALPLIEKIAAKKPAGEPVNILTHCNAGWLATVDWGTATSPIYQAHDAGIPVHVWVDETRPRNQGFNLTAWELLNHGVPHTVIVDNAGGHLMQHGQVDLVFVGTDRTTASGDVCNKIGTYLKALAAHDNNVPFYVCLPSPTIDWTVHNGVNEIPIEERSGEEVTHIAGLDENGNVSTIQIPPAGSPAANPAFDVTPAKYVTGLVTERGICDASAEGLSELFPDRS